ncbi:15579_t:CDS:2 [Funneliformis geosporum]|uniref:15579_t:CDS:1 n=1 Tax=Funneliformis geosporum TaxID=1117311 RepID=A0A9W4X1D4_9GLOM|nr:15579_t:CDS:2 [Funneliformis geosporum]
MVSLFRQMIMINVVPFSAKAENQENVKEKEIIDNQLKGKYAIADLKDMGTFDPNRDSLYLNKFCIDHGLLLAIVQGKRKLGNFGSRLPPNDSLWDTYSRGIQCNVIRTKNPDTIALVTDDSDYEPITTMALKYNWIVETWFWDLGISFELKNKTIFTPLDKYSKSLSFSYGFGPNITKTIDYRLSSSVLEKQRYNGTFLVWTSSVGGNG